MSQIIVCFSAFLLLKLLFYRFYNKKLAIHGIIVYPDSRSYYNALNVLGNFAALMTFSSSLVYIKTQVFIINAAIVVLAVLLFILCNYLLYRLARLLNFA